VIRFQPPVEWVYRGSGVKAPDVKGGAGNGAGE
jgi:hypothetical protein